MELLPLEPLAFAHEEAEPPTLAIEDEAEPSSLAILQEQRSIDVSVFLRIPYLELDPNRFDTLDRNSFCLLC